MLEDCLNNSKHRCKNTWGTPFPARIIALDMVGDDEIAIRVVQDRQLGEKYAALSHCWGSQLTCTTTTSNLSQRMQGVAWPELPRTFQDAIRFCARLGIFYIWIDSLCIIQDDPDDWQVHSSQMADIYQNSFITLSATSAADGSVGCFPEQAALQRGWSTKFQPSINEIYEMVIRRELTHRWAHNTVTKQENPLLSRGWAFQERVLSPRVLHFCKEEMVWECANGTVCECGSMPSVPNLKEQFAFAARMPEVSDDDMIIVEQGSSTRQPHLRSSVRRTGVLLDEQNQLRVREGGDKANGTMRLRISLSGMETTAVSAIGQWHGIVHQYSVLELTKQEDRLPALSGIAERMKPYLGTFVAGLWTSSIMQDLLWRVDKRLVRPHRLVEAYYGPSWSWVSVGRSVSFVESNVGPKPYQNQNPAGRHVTASSAAQLFSYDNYSPARVYRCDIQVMGKNPYGRVSSATLLVEGHIRRARWILSNRQYYIVLGTEPEPKTQGKSTKLKETNSNWREELGGRGEPGRSGESARRAEYGRERESGRRRGSGRRQSSTSQERISAGELEFVFFKDEEWPEPESDRKVILLMMRQNVFLVLKSVGLEYERVGLLEVPAAWSQRVDFMSSSHKTTVMII